MRRLYVALIALLPAFAMAGDEVWLGLFMNGSKLGYSRTSVQPDEWRGGKAVATNSLTVIQAGMLGASLDMRIDAKTLADDHGRPLAMTFNVSSAGRTNKVSAVFEGSVLVCDVDNGTSKSVKRLAIPPDGRIVDDPLTDLVLGNSPIGKVNVFYILDPMTVTLVRSEATVVGPRKVEVRGQTYDSTLIEINDPRASTQAFINGKGELLKAVGPLGIEMIPLSREEALQPTPVSDRPDLVGPVSIPIKGDSSKISSSARVTLRVTGKELKALPTDTHQTVRKDGDSWIVEIHPVTPRSDRDKPVAVSESFAVPGTNIPSSTAPFPTLAKDIVGDTKDAWVASDRIAKYVYGRMTPNGGIGVLRDAREVLETSEGVCRDYAILTTTLLRAASIPSRLVAGLVQDSGRLYYHAWAEAWDGQTWFGVDSTRPDGHVTAGHLKLAEGSVETAFVFPVLDHVKVEILNAE